jgi:hypothetical protein
VIQRETFGSALDMGVEAMKLLGVRSYRAHRAAQIFKHHDEAALKEVATMEGDDTVVIARSRQLSRDLEQLLRTDEQDLSHIEDGAWDVSALRKDAK